MSPANYQMNKWLNDQMIDWMIDWLTVWPFDWLPIALTDRTDRQTEQTVSLSFDRITVCFTMEWMNNWLFH